MSYMISVWFFGLVWLLLIWYYPRMRPCIAASSLMFLPAGLAQPLFVPEYWDPAVMFKMWGTFDLESLLFAFFTGGIASALYPALSGRRPAGIPEKVEGVKWHLFWLVPVAGAAGLLGAARWAQFPVIYAGLAILGVGVVHMLIVRSDLIRTALWGAILFCLMYAGIGVIMDRAFPGFIKSTWNTEMNLDLYFLGIPAEEYLYGALFGGLWSIVYCGVFNCRFIDIRGGAERSAGTQGREAQF